MYPSVGIRAFRRNLVVGILLWCVSVPAHAQPYRDSGDTKKSAEGEKVYEAGGDVKRPKLVHYVEPEFSPKSKEAFVEGTVKISTVITSEGVPTSYRVVSGLNSEEDRTAVEALKQWRFEPGTKDGQPVNVRVTVEIDFHLL